jgi:phytoene dehydrogenase-like protein
MTEGRDGPPRNRVDAVVVGSGPNGLAAAVRIAQAGRSVVVLEARDDIGGGARTDELTIPGFLHDTFSAIHPLGVGAPFLRSLPLETHGLEWIHPPIPLAHPLDTAPPALLERSFEQTGESLDGDGSRWRALMEPLTDRWEELSVDALAPLRVPKHPLLLGRFGLRAFQSSDGLSRRSFRHESARALFAGIAAHAAVPLNRPATAAFGLILAAAGHAVGWPIARGGSGQITRALASYLRSLGGSIRTGVHVRSLAELPPARTVLLDVTPKQLLQIAGDRLPARFRRRLQGFRYGPGVFKLDWALAAPIPWRSPECARAGTVHLGGTREEISRSLQQVWGGAPSPNPYCLIAQPSVFDPTRAPAGQHVGWGYCHVPNGCETDMTEQIEGQVERFAPGFRDLILARHAMGPSELERRNPNLVGGDINGGAAILGQMFLRPVLARSPYTLPAKGLYLCSSSTPPGGGVHGMCGYHAAETALRDGL